MTPDPFPHVVATDWFDAELLDACLTEMPRPELGGWKQYGNDNEMKLEGPCGLWGKYAWRYFDLLEAMAGDLASMFDLPELSMEMVGGGYHLIPPGGFLNVHTDFSRSPSTGRYRRVNVLTYLNRDWTEPGGHLELWDAEACAVSVAPEFGTTVAFVTSASSWHGHPVPAQRWRASLAAYFFTDDPPPDFREQSTVWHPNGGRR